MSTSAERTRTYRQRQKSGVIMLVIEAPEDSLARALIEACLLHPDLADDRVSVQAAAQKLIEVIAREKII
jgi:hypothetical protein